MCAFDKYRTDPVELLIRTSVVVVLAVTGSAECRLAFDTRRTRVFCTNASSSNFVAKTFRLFLATVETRSGTRAKIR